MTRPMKREDPDARAERILAELHTITREAAGVLKDLDRVIGSARARVDEYAHHEVESVLARYTTEWQQGAERFLKEMKADVTGHITNWTAVVQNEIPRTAIFQEAVDSILAELLRRDETRARMARVGDAGVVISVCDRPHAD